MNRLLQSAWRALLDTLRPSMLALSLLPLAATAVLGLVAHALFWEGWLASMQAWLQTQTWLLDLLRAVGWTQPVQGLSMALLMVCSILALLLSSLLLVAALVMPVAGPVVARARYAQLQQRGRGRLLQSLLWSLWITLAGLAALLLSLPLWFIPVVGWLIAPLIWGWMTAQMFAFDAVVQFASVPERRQLLRDHRWSLLLMGVSCGYLSVLPTLLFGLGWLVLALLPVFTLLALWLYVLSFVFTALWFVHYLLAALAAGREQLVITA
ncbi:MAG: EI24 domain-containing protein [Thiomonas sp.]